MKIYIQLFTFISDISAKHVKSCCVMSILHAYFTGEASLYQQTMPDCVSTIAMGRDKLKYPQSEKKRHDGEA